MQMLIIPIIALLFFFGLSYQVTQSQDTVNATNVARNLGTNLALYRRAVANYAAANPTFTGTVGDAALGLPAWYKKIRGISNLISGGRTYVYFSEVALINFPAMNEIASAPSALVGIKQSGKLVSPASTTTFVLPAIIPDGSIVYIL